MRKEGRKTQRGEEKEGSQTFDSQACPPETPALGLSIIPALHFHVWEMGTSPLLQEQVKLRAQKRMEAPAELSDLRLFHTHCLIKLT